MGDFMPATVTATPSGPRARRTTGRCRRWATRSAGPTARTGSPSPSCRPSSSRSTTAISAPAGRLEPGAGGREPPCGDAVAAGVHPGRSRGAPGRCRPARRSGRGSGPGGGRRRRPRTPGRGPAPYRPSTSARGSTDSSCLGSMLTRTSGQAPRMSSSRGIPLAAPLVVARVQPKSSSSGSNRAPVEERNPAAATRAPIVIAATNQARCQRRVRSGPSTVVVTGQA